jgi:hypothetical protein
VKINFASLLRAVRRGLPLPFALVSKHPNLLGIDNLVDFIVTCTKYPKAANQTFLVEWRPRTFDARVNSPNGQGRRYAGAGLLLPVWAL